MSKKNAVRRNRALRKIRKAQHVDPEIKLAVEVILDLLSGQSDYNVAWPSAATIAKRLKRSRRTGQWYVKIIKALGIFQCVNFPPKDAVAFCESRFGFRPKLDRCNQYGPNLYVVNPEHPIWDHSKSLPDDVDREMGETIQRIKAMRNAKTTSRRASNPAKHPQQQAVSDPKRVYCLKTFQDRLRKTVEALRDDDANDTILNEAEEERWCRERLSNDVANDTNNDVANDAQVFRLSSVEADDLIAPPSESLKAVASPSVIESLKGLPSGSPARGPREPNTPPPRHSARGSAGQSQREKFIALTSESRSTTRESVGTDFVVPSNFAGTDPYRHQVPGQGANSFGSELIETMKRLETESKEKLRRLASNAANRPDAVEEELSGWFLRR